MWSRRMKEFTFKRESFKKALHQLTSFQNAASESQEGALRRPGAQPGHVWLRPARSVNTLTRLQPRPPARRRSGSLPTLSTSSPLAGQAQSVSKPAH